MIPDRERRDQDRLDREAARFFSRATGERLPHEIDSGRFAGDRSPSRSLRERVAGGLEARVENLSRLQWLESEIEAIGIGLDRLRLHADVFRAHLSGESESAIAARHGRASHSWTSEILSEIQAWMAERAHGAEPIAVKCGLAGCPNIVTRRSKGGSVRRYCCEEHRAAAEQKRRRLRRGSEWAARTRRERRARALEGPCGAPTDIAQAS